MNEILDLYRVSKILYGNICDIKSIEPAFIHDKSGKPSGEIIREATGCGLNVNVMHPSGISGPNDSGRGHLTTLVIDFHTRRLTASIISACEKGRRRECYNLSNG